MNNKGFTLVELIATIALLAVISVISFVSINAVINDNKVRNCKNLIGNIKNAVKEYVSDNRYNKDFVKGASNNGMYVSIDAQELIDNRYLSSPIVNPFDGTEYSKPEDLKKLKVGVHLNDDYTIGNFEYIKFNEKKISCDDGEW